MTVILMTHCKRHHYHCYCSVSGGNHEDYETDYGTRFTYKEKEYKKVCIANEQKQGIDQCSLQ